MFHPKPLQISNEDTVWLSLLGKLADNTLHSIAVDTFLSMFLAHEWDNCAQYAI